MKAFLTTTVSIPLWLVLLVLAGAFAHISSLTDMGIEKWKEADTATAQLQQCQNTQQQLKENYGQPK
ncbi:hypothetical protein [Variovorax sp. W2I14]|uniref:hypothetical protein n=1 Tax=Variovorax sp. W2I14 TaxID=3042290 RepID=UPI003D1A5FC5